MVKSVEDHRSSGPRIEAEPTSGLHLPEVVDNVSSPSAIEQKEPALERQPPKTTSSVENELQITDFVVNSCRDAVSPSTLLLKGHCNSLPATFLLDTGSAVSLVSSTFLKQLALQQPQSLGPLIVERSDVKLSSITNNQLLIHGEIKLNVNILSSTHEFTFIVTEFQDFDFLLGLDMMKHAQLTLDFKNNQIVGPAGSAPLSVPRVPKKRVAIRCAQTMVISPNTGISIRGKIPLDTYNDNHSYQGIVSPNPNLLLRKGLVAANALVTTEGKFLPVRCVNVTDEPVTVYKNQLLGQFEASTVHNDTPCQVRRISQDTICDDGIDGMEDNHVMEDNSVNCQEIDEEPPILQDWTKDRLFSELNIAQINLPESSIAELKTVIWENRDCFSRSQLDVGCCNMYRARIELKNDYTPQWMPSRPVPYKRRDAMNKKLEELRRSGVISRAKEMSNWNTRVMLVPKPHNKDDFRFCADMRALNSQVVTDAFELVNINHVTDQISGAEWYSCLDFSQSFHQISLTPDSKSLTSFLCNGVRYWYNRLVMGFKNASSQFSRAMLKFTQSCPIQTLIYFLDDLLLWSSTVEDHIKKLDQLFHCLRSAGFKLAPSKCSLLKKQISWIGISISKDGLRVTEDRAQAVLELKPPKNKKELQKVMGFLGYNRRFVPLYAEYAHSLYKLLGKDTVFEWTDRHQEDFEELKRRIASSDCLAIPDLSPDAEEFELEIDGSNRAIAGILYQTQRGVRRTVAYFSKSLPPHKRKWGQTKIEFTALCAAIKHWEIYLRGAKNFTVKTDCLSLTNLDTIFSKNSPLLFRQLESLQDFNFRVVHHGASANFQADFLSRYNFGSDEKSCCYTCDQCGHQGRHNYNDIRVYRTHLSSEDSTTSAERLYNLPQSESEMTIKIRSQHYIVSMRNVHLVKLFLTSLNLEITLSWARIVPLTRLTTYQQ